MAKRFTATEKWEDLWFCELTLKQKLFWIYLLDKCDNAGIWEKNFKVASFFIEPISEQEAVDFLKDKIIPINDNKWFVPKFIEFQYGVLNESSNPHRSVIEKLTKLGIYENGKLKGKITLKRVPGRVKDKEQDIDKEQDKDMEQEKANPLPFVDIWNVFAKQYNISEIRELTKSREDKLKLRLKNPLFDIYKILESAKEQPFLFGENNRNWKMSFDWLVKNDENYLKILELNYKSNGTNQNRPNNKGFDIEESKRNLAAAFNK